jgi:Carboxypeptidase regulatory-like domain
MSRSIFGGLFVACSLLLHQESGSAQCKSLLVAHVTDTTGQPLEGAWVTILEAGVKHITGPDGGVVVSLPGGYYTVRAALIRYTSVQQDSVGLRCGKANLLSLRLAQQTSTPLESLQVTGPRELTR